MRVALSCKNRYSQMGFADSTDFHLVRWHNCAVELLRRDGARGCIEASQVLISLVEGAKAVSRGYSPVKTYSYSASRSIFGGP
jgi:hypothetical protein